MDLTKLLSQLDQFLEKEETIIVCGGMAVALGYGGTRETIDVDVIAPVPLSEHLKQKIQRVAQKEKCDPDWLNDACKGFASYLPEGWRNRLIRIDQKFKRLRLFVLGKPDLLMLKLKAGRERDLEDIQTIGMTQKDAQVILKHLDKIINFDSKTAITIKLRLEEWGYV